MADYAVRVVHDGRATEILLSGELGIEVAGELTSAGADAARTTDHPRVVIDLGEVTFLDSTGIGALVSIRSAALEAGKEFGVRNVPPRVQRLLAITGLTDAFPVE